MYSFGVFPDRLCDTEAQRQASQDSLSLSEESLEEYRRLFVACFTFDYPDSPSSDLQKGSS